MPIEKRKITDLIPYENNPRSHPEKQVSQLARLMDKYGFHDSHAIAIDEQGTIIWGHGRLLAAKEIGLEEVPVEVLPNLSEEDKRALRIGDNSIADQSDWDIELLKGEILDLDAQDFPLEMLSLDEGLLEELGKAIAYDERLLEGLGKAIGADEEIYEAKNKKYTPKTTDNDYSSFELIMLYENKRELIIMLNRVKNEYNYEKQEEALMHIIKEFSKAWSPE